jgi:hypothetical protein
VRLHGGPLVYEYSLLARIENISALYKGVGTASAESGEGLDCRI